jgi:transposase
VTEREYQEALAAKDALLAAKDQRIAELEAQTAQLQTQLAAALARISDLEAQVADLKARLGQNSSNSSRPPSSDFPPLPSKPQAAGKRKRGAQKGHKWLKKELLPLEQVTGVVPCYPTACRSCQATLTGSDPSPLRHQVVEIPELHPQVIEYQLHRLYCPSCQKTTCATLPDGVPLGHCGPRLLSLIAVLAGQYHLSKGLIQQLLFAAFGIPISMGTISNAEQIVSQAIQEPVLELQKAIVHQALLNMDETGWRNQGNLIWIWLIVAPLLVLVSIRESRSAEEAKELLAGGTFETLTTDRFGGYNWVALERRQICWAHLLRNFEALKARGGEDGELGGRLLEEGKQLMVLWQRFKAGELSRQEFQEQAMPLKHWVKLYIYLGAFCRPVRCRKLFVDLWKVEPALWTFVWKEGVEPTNNVAERAIRPAVLYRKISQGTQSERGKAYISRLLTVVETLKQQGRNILEYLTQALQAFFSQGEAPSLLPLAADTS